ncbi:ferrous iron transport protein B [Mariniblastus fucicola]|uniref:Ferrous iron transport protein B n=1 Tax=Mariniblastus fucicola TaxID=980251 RepID=A0A5B9PK93_9BACT|nr:ferrous iron transport protein B [Mariniblastus fucicola]QEG25106.1 Ferrous iron transport protein B [Mariniblastus fucicola]
MANPVKAAPGCTVVVLGNPNAGKSTLFNGLTGVRQHVGNYPGVTVEKRSGLISIDDEDFELVDLPGTYSLAPTSPEEMLAVKILLGKPPAAGKPDVILCVIDASNMQRNLFLVSQVLELNQPTVVAVNMVDVAKRNGVEIDCEKLQQLLGVPVVPVQAKRREGFDALKRAIADSRNKNPDFPHDPFEASLKDRIEQLESTCPDDCALKRFAVTRMLFDTDGFMADQLKSEVGPTTLESVESEKQKMESGKEPVFESESSARYSWITRHSDEFIKQTGPVRASSITDRLDAWLTHPIWGLGVALLVSVMLFQLVFWIADPASDMIDWFNGTLASIVNGVVPAGTLNSLLVDGLINGVGSVLIFLPQILLLFLILALLEDSGYLARAAFLMDRYLSKIGLSGVTLFPLLSSFACAIPGIMATRVIKNDRERLVTILIAPLMSCSARLPVYVLLIATFVPAQSYLGGLLGLRGLTMFAMYMVGIVVAVIVAWILRRTFVKSPPTSFVLEMPSYKVPSLRNVGQRMFDGGWSFIRDAGTIIVAVTILVWAAAYFPRLNESNPPAELTNDFAVVQRLEPQLETLADDAAERPSIESELAVAQNNISAFHLRQSYLGRSGKLIEPVVKPLGWDWRIGSAAIASFPAREVVVSTMGVIFGLGSEVDEESDSLREQLAAAKWEGSDRPLFTLPVALSLMVFFALCAQCVSTLAVIKRETNSWFWPTFSFVYMTVLAYIGAFAVYQIFSRMIS